LKATHPEPEDGAIHGTVILNLESKLVWVIAWGQSFECLIKLELTIKRPNGSNGNASYHVNGTATSKKPRYCVWVVFSLFAINDTWIKKEKK
jgi:hypothetical protein